MIDPPLHEVVIDSRFFDDEFSYPAVVPGPLHGSFSPFTVPLSFISNPCRDGIVAIGKNICRYHDLFANDSLDREATAIDFWLYIFNNDSSFVPFFHEVPFLN